MKYLFVLIAFFSAAILSQESEVASDDQENAVNETPASVAVPDEPDSDTNSNSEDFEVFNPSEDISEDLSVPFPADI